MRKNLWICLGITAFVMFWLPMFAIMAGADEALAACLLLFFVVNPIYAVAIGCYAGANSKERWSLPLFTSLMFLVGVWTMFTFKEVAFILYAGWYLVLGYFSMMITTNIIRVIQKKKKRK